MQYDSVSYSTKREGEIPEISRKNEPIMEANDEARMWLGFGESRYRAAEGMICGWSRGENGSGEGGSGWLGSLARN